MSSFKKFNINKVDGVTHRIPFTFPGEDTSNEYIDVRSQYCKEFRDMQAKIQRQISSMIIANKGEPVSEDVREEMTLRTIATLVAGWSFDEEPTIENVMEFLESNPHIYDQVNMTAAKDSLFFKKEESN